MKSIIFAAGLCISTIAYAQTTGSAQSGTQSTQPQSTQPMSGQSGTMGSAPTQERWGTTTPMQRGTMGQGGTMGQQNQPMQGSSQQPMGSQMGQQSQGSQNGQWGQSSTGNGMTGTDRGMGGPAMNQGNRDYPRCSRTVRDSCTQMGPRG